MDRHHDQFHPYPAGPDPTRPGIGEQLADRLAIPGDVPPTVWHFAPAHQRGCLSPQLARQLLDECTQVGDVVLDVDDDVALAATAAATGRRHHALAGEHHLAAMGHAAGYIDLILLHWPRPAVNPRWLLRACRSLLGATGRVVVAVSADADHRVAHLIALGGAAAKVELYTIRHVAVFAPDTAMPVAATNSAGGRRSPRPAGTRGTARATSSINHPHIDLLILGVEVGNE
jgi:hypothetical protein